MACQRYPVILCYICLENQLAILNASVSLKTFNLINITKHNTQHVRHTKFYL